MVDVTLVSNGILKRKYSGSDNGVGYRGRGNHPRIYHFPYRKWKVISSQSYMYMN